MPKPQLRVRPFLDIGGWYLVRGWSLWLARHYGRRILAYAVGVGTCALIPVLGYQSGANAVAVHSLGVEQAQAAALPLATTQSVPPAAVQPKASPVVTASFSYRRRANNAYAYGNCTYYVANRRAVPGNWGNARSWYISAQFSGFAVGLEPRVGAIAWTSAGYFGHVALVEAVSGSRVYVSEMNYRGWNYISYRWVAASQFKYIY